jgi:hypothetical protein
MLLLVISVALCYANVYQAQYYRDPSCSGLIISAQNIPSSDTSCIPQGCQSSTSVYGPFFTVTCPSSFITLGVDVVKYSNNTCSTIVSTVTYAAAPACTTGNTYTCKATLDHSNSTVYHNIYANNDCTGVLTSSILIVDTSRPGCDELFLKYICTKSSLASTPTTLTLSVFVLILISVML